MQPIDVPPGTYIAAISGGVDSMVLLDMLSHAAGAEVVVAHFDHGIRPESSRDAQFVAAAARRYGLPYVSERVALGAAASEATAREARYAFLRKVQAEQGARGIITAHHEDDALETAIINMVRGTGRKGLSALNSAHDILRPLLHVPKQAIMEYAAEHAIAWQEDSTNSDERYLRNYIRHQVIGRMAPAAKRQLLRHIATAATANPLIDHLIDADIAAHTTPAGMQRSWFISLPHDVSCETLAAWLRTQGIREFSRQDIIRLVIAAKTAVPGKRFDINAAYLLEVGQQGLQVVHRQAS